MVGFSVTRPCYYRSPCVWRVASLFARIVFTSRVAPERSVIRDALRIVVPLAVPPGPTSCAPVTNTSYHAFTDAAGGTGNDAYAFAIGHKQGVTRDGDEISRGTRSRPIR